MSYFEIEESIFYRLNSTDYKKAIEVIANKYIGDNPPLPFVFRAHNANGIKCLETGEYEIDFSAIYPEAKKGSYAYAAADIYSQQDGIKGIALTCLGKVELYVNGQPAYLSDHTDESNLGRRNNVIFPVQKGRNSLFIKCKKLCDGYFGAKISGNSPKWAPLLFFAPFWQRKGQSGFVYSNCVAQDIFAERDIPQTDREDFCEQLKWYPNCEWCKEEKEKSAAVRLFGAQKDKYCLAWSKLIGEGEKEIHISGSSDDALAIYIDGARRFTSESGDFQFSLSLPYREHDIIVAGYDYTLNVDAELKLPGNIKGGTGEWLYLGCFDKNFVIEDIKSYQTFYNLFDCSDGNSYWRLDAPNTFVRPSLENEGFGKWSYPYGVTLYGLIQAGRVLKRDDIVQYVKRHVAQIVSLYRYAIWDKKTYGYPNINQQLLWFSALDDVGSFGSLMLETFGKETDDPLYPEVACLAKDIADYIINRLEKTEDGAFYRIHGEERTLWADDLYMSVPFLIRYYELTNDTLYLEEAGKQFALYKKYLWMDDYNIYSHVYDFRRGSKSNAPWGRGNGWVFFSLSEFLEKMPSDFHMKPQLLELFREMTDGYLKLQGENGLWHQVLNDATTYEETSCTSMIMYALARGLRMGILNDTAVIRAAKEAWEGLTKIAIDQNGNIYGVCRGSGYSFDPEYYRHLDWNFNDTHGIGIVMLAGIELEKTLDFLRGKDYE